MCGIVGIVNTQAPVDEGIILRMRDSIAHRGPDDAGLYVSPDRKVALGNRRLAIIDLSAAGHQPLCNEDGTVWITYNGEVYNFQELQCELVNKGHVFKSHTDTEVIVHGYEEWGIEELLVRLRGMFAFAILDTRERLRRHAAPRHATLHAPRLFLARDRFGIKPLYYFHDDGKLVFASEVRALLQSHLVPDETEPKAIIGFFIFGSVPTPYTTVRNVYSIPAGHYAVYGDGRFQLIKYYDVLPSDGSRDRSAPYYTGRDVTAEAGASAGRKKARADTVYEEIRQILEEDVRLHLISDAPLGVFLSGGIDSSALVALASQHRSEPLTTLSVIFEEQEFTEQAFQKMIAEQYHTVHHEVMVRGQDFWEDLPRIFEAMDQPTVDGVNTYFVSKAAKESGLKVVLSGLGGDEVFCGYESFKWIGLLRRVQALPLPLEWPLRFVRGWPRGSGDTKTPGFFKKPGVWDDVKPDATGFGRGVLGGLADRWKKAQYLFGKDDLSLYLAVRALFTPDEVARLIDASVDETRNLLKELSPGRMALEPIEFLSAMETKFYLQNQLLRDTDFMSMFHSIETRVPYVDYVLMECVQKTSPRLRVHRGVSKPLLANPLADSLPRDIIHRRKQGFTFPFALWLGKSNGRFLDGVVRNGMLSQKRVFELWQGFREGRMHWSRVWALAVADRWLR